MKQLVYHIIVCGMAVLFLTACEKDDDISGRSMEKNGNIERACRLAGFST